MPRPAYNVSQLHEGLKKLNIKPQIKFLPEDFDEFTNGGYLFPV
jgi:hypothetical protein